MSSLVATTAVLSLVPALAAAQEPWIESLAGTGVAGTAGDGGPATLAELAYPLDVCVDGAGNVFVEDDENGAPGVSDRIRRIDGDTGTITTVVGGGVVDYPNDGLPATAIALAPGYHPIAVDSEGALHFGESYTFGVSSGPFGGPWGHGMRIRRVDPTSGVVTTIAGGDAATQSVTVNVCGDLHEFALPSGDGGPATAAFLTEGFALAFDAADNLYVAGEVTVRRIDRVTGVITTVAGNGAREVVGVSGNPCLGWTYSGVYGGDGGPATAASLVGVVALAVAPDGDVIIGDADYAGGFGVPGRPTNHRVRRVDAVTGVITTVCGSSQLAPGGFAGDGGPAVDALTGPVWGLAVDAEGHLFLADNDNSRLRRVDAVTGIIETIAGDGTFAASGDGGPAALATFGYLWDLAFTPSGELVLSDADGLRVRRINGLAANLPPAADAGLDQSIHAGQLVQLDGSASDDDATPAAALGYAWELVTRPASSIAALSDAGAVAPTFVADVPGTYVARLVVTDAGGLASAPDEVTIASTNQAPTANAGLDAVALVGDVVALDAAASADPDGDGLSFAWALVSVPAGSAATLDDPAAAGPRFVADLEGPYVAALFVDDGFGPSLVDEVVVTALAAQAFATVLVVDAAATLTALDPAAVTSSGNQQSLVRTLTTAAQALESGNDALARRRLEAALERTDGCVLRGAPDAQGAGRDWVTDCAAQSALYADLSLALLALSS